MKEDEGIRCNTWCVHPLEKTKQEELFFRVLHCRTQTLWRFAQDILSGSGYAPT